MRQLSIAIACCIVSIAACAGDSRNTRDSATSALQDAGAANGDASHVLQDAASQATGADDAASQRSPDGGAGNTLDASGSASDAALTPADDALQGWAAEDGDGVPTTTGGAGGRTVSPTNAQELLDYAASDEPLVIELNGTFAVPRLQVASNKTLVGVGEAGATIQGGVRIRGKADAFVQNVILANLHVDAKTSDVDGDGVQIYYAHHVWVDHCDVFDAPDGNLDIVHASSWVTVSWTRFRYTSAAPAPDHRFSNLIGHTDGNDEDEARLRVSFHHCHWAEGVIERMPRVRYGQVHVWNNLYDAQGNNYCVGAGYESRLRIEGNVFDGVSDPHLFYDGEPTAQIAAGDNAYLGASATAAHDMGQGASFTAPYPYALEPNTEVKARVLAGVGPR